MFRKNGIFLASFLLHCLLLFIRPLCVRSWYIIKNYADNGNGCIRVIRIILVLITLSKCEW